MKSNIYGQVQISEAEAVTALYNKKITDLENIYLEDPAVIEKFNKARRQNADKIPDLVKLTDTGIDIESWDKIAQDQWFMPQFYKDFDIESWLFDQCANETQVYRVQEELELFVQHNMMSVLRYIKYLVDTMRKEKIVWGIGRGSSVSSYILFLIGIHKVDSIRYELDIHEFLK